MDDSNGAIDDKEFVEPIVPWSDIVGLDSVKEALVESTKSPNSDGKVIYNGILLSGVHHIIKFIIGLNHQSP